MIQREWFLFLIQTQVCRAAAVVVSSDAPRRTDGVQTWQQEVQTHIKRRRRLGASQTEPLWFWKYKTGAKQLRGWRGLNQEDAEVTAGQSEPFHPHTLEQGTNPWISWLQIQWMFCSSPEQSRKTGMKTGGIMERKERKEQREASLARGALRKQLRLRETLRLI